MVSGTPDLNELKSAVKFLCMLKTFVLSKILLLIPILWSSDWPYLRCQIPFSPVPSHLERSCDNTLNVSQRAFSLMIKSIGGKSRITSKAAEGELRLIGHIHRATSLFSFDSCFLTLPSL